MTGDISGTDISLTVPYGTDVTALVATFTTTGTSVIVEGGSQTSGPTANDFTNSVTYRVTAEDGTTQDSTVSVNSEEFYISPNIGKLCTVPTGSFKYSSDPADICTIDTFSLGESEITRAQFLAVMGADPSNSDHSSGTDNPVQTLNWYHCIAFCNKLSIMEGLTPVYTVTVGGTDIDFESLAYADIPTADNGDWNSLTTDWDANGYRLPTEMEWMWAAMGATLDARSGDIVNDINTDGLNKGYAGSTESGLSQNNIADYGWINANYDGKTHPVKEKLPNEVGLYDMTGHVAEWTWDLYGAWPSGTQVNYRGPNTGTKRTVVGGHWADWCSNEEYYLYARGEDLDGPGVKYELTASIIGFRVARY